MTIIIVDNTQYIIINYTGMDQTQVLEKNTSGVWYDWT